MLSAVRVYSVSPRRHFLLALALLPALFHPAIAAEPVADPDALKAVNARLSKLESENAALAAKNLELTRRLDVISETPPPADVLNLPRTMGSLDDPAALPDSPAMLPPPESPAVRTLIGGYDTDRGAFILARSAPGQCPAFDLRADIMTQVRYANFTRSVDTWTDSTGAQLPVRSLQSIEVTRNLVQLAGSALDPRLQFSANIFSSTAFNDTVYAGWMNYQFSEAFDLRIGNWVVPGTREWLDSFRYTLGTDRLMATTFFRPNMSPGIWAQGSPVEGVRYVVMLANSLNRFPQGVDRRGSSRAIAGTAWWEPWGAFGPGPSDFENSPNSRIRLGMSGAFSREANQGVTDEAFRNPEDTIIRLSDGTPLFRPGSLAAGTELTSAQKNLWTVDVGWKRSGFSVGGEYFFRVLNGFKMARGQVPFSSLFDHGALLQSGLFIVPKRWELFARSSAVTGRFGTGYEYGGGVNWYPHETRDWRLTGEVLSIHKSPAQNILTGYRAGASGTLFQAQCLVDF